MTLRFSSTDTGPDPAALQKLLVVSFEQLNRELELAFITESKVALLVKSASDCFSATVTATKS
jgi:hypothetical protein